MLKSIDGLDYSDEEEDNDIYDLVGQEPVECSHVAGPRSKGEFCHINEVLNPISPSPLQKHNKPQK